MASRALAKKKPNPLPPRMVQAYSNSEDYWLGFDADPKREDIVTIPPYTGPNETRHPIDTDIIYLIEWLSDCHEEYQEIEGWLADADQPEVNDQAKVAEYQQKLDEITAQFFTRPTDAELDKIEEQFDPPPTEQSAIDKETAIAAAETASATMVQQANKQKKEKPPKPPKPPSRTELWAMLAAAKESGDEARINEIRNQLKI